MIYRGGSSVVVVAVKSSLFATELPYDALPYFKRDGPSTKKHGNRDRTLQSRSEQSQTPFVSMNDVFINRYG